MKCLRYIAHAAVLLQLLVIPAAAAAPDDCRQARELYNRSLTLERAGAISELDKALELCPTLHVVAVRLGLLHQEAGRFRAARMYYRRSIPSDLGDPLPWIGLADIDYARGRYESASGLYRRVLDRLSREKDRPGLKELRNQEHGIRLRYERARIKAGVHFDSLRRLVSVNRILEALVPPATEHSNNSSPLHERVAMNIAFEVDAPRLLPRGREQLERVALAFNSPALSGSDFLIEGHSDTLGDSYNNLYLSLLSARAVRDFLVEKGVDRQRLRVIGVGSARPLADSDNQQDQGINRRMEFVNLQR